MGPRQLDALPISQQRSRSVAGMKDVESLLENPDYGARTASERPVSLRYEPPTVDGFIALR